MTRACRLRLTKVSLRLALTGDAATDPTDAGGTQLIGCASGTWDTDLRAAVGWNPDHLPPMVPSWGTTGHLRHARATRWHLWAGLPMATGAGDNMAATLGTSGVVCSIDADFYPCPA